MKFLALSSITAAVLVGGCQSPHTAAPRLAASPAPATAVASVRLPETVRTYTLGAQVDADDPTVRHTAHEIHRIEQPARWQFGPPPEDHAPSAPPPPPPLPPPTPTLTVTPTPAPILTAPPVAPTPPAETPAPVVVSSTPTTPAVEAPPPELVPALAPNADGLVDLTAPETTREPDDINPFAVRASAVTTPREIKLIVSGVVGGATPGAIINGVPLKVGEPIESLILERVEADAVLLRRGERRVRLPVSTTAYRLRLAS